MESALRPASEPSIQAAPSALASVLSTLPAPVAVAGAEKESKKAQLPGSEQKGPRVIGQGTCGWPPAYSGATHPPASPLGASSALKVPSRTPGKGMGPTPLPAPSSSQVQKEHTFPHAPMTTLVPQDSAKAPQEGKSAAKTPQGAGENRWSLERR